MTGYITDCEKAEYKLPQLISWEVNHTGGYPADSFEASFIYEPDMLETLEKAVRFRGQYDGGTVFQGVVDEFTVSISSAGSIGKITGRGMAALLMDNEVESVEFYACTLADILRNYVTPFGITDVQTENMQALQGYSVSSGDSAWKALSRFTECAGNITPRFTKEGKLVISSQHGNRFSISRHTASEYLLKETRYGEISQVLVKNPVIGTSETVLNGEFINRGGFCRRIVNVPRKTGADAMRYTGDYQISKSKKGKFQLKVTVPEPFSVFPRDVVELHGEAGFSGEYIVGETKSFSDGYGCGEIITLEKFMGD